MAQTTRAPYQEHPDQLELPLGDAIDPELAIFCHPLANLTVRAKPMLLGDYLDLRNWRKDYPDLQLEQDGYLVERPDMGPPNHPDYPFFIAWIGKTAFDLYYRRGNLNNYKPLSLVTESSLYGC